MNACVHNHHMRNRPLDEHSDNLSHIHWDAYHITFVFPNGF